LFSTLMNPLPGSSIQKKVNTSRIALGLVNQSLVQTVNC